MQATEEPKEPTPKNIILILIAMAICVAVALVIKNLWIK